MKETCAASETPDLIDSKGPILSYAGRPYSAGNYESVPHNRNNSRGIGPP